MYPLGHVGIGMRIVPARVRAVVSAGWLAFGCLLPDLIDKPVFVGARVARRALPDSFDVWLDVLRGSRLFGHSLFFFAAVIVAARLTRAYLGASNNGRLEAAAEYGAGGKVTPHRLRRRLDGRRRSRRRAQACWL